MALLGNELDLYVRKYTDMIDHELQQAGSVLESAITVEPGVMGERTYFNRIGAIDSIEELSSRFTPITLDEATYERRFVTPQFLHKAQGLDPLDVVRMSASPQSDVVQAMTYGIGRKKDAIILGALGGTALREVAGSSSNASFDNTNNDIAVDTNTYTTLSGNTSLHEGKIQLAVQKLQGSQVDMSRTEVFVIASAAQLGALRARILSAGYGRKDFFNKTPLNIPGLDMSLDGLFGLRFIHYEGLADAANLPAATTEYAYVFTKAAVKVGVWEPLRVDISERKDLKHFPLQMAALMTIGAVRMDEKQVIRIRCAQ